MKDCGLCALPCVMEQVDRQRRIGKDRGDPATGVCLPLPIPPGLCGIQSI